MMQHTKTLSELFFVKIKRCSFTVYNSSCKLTTVFVPNSVVENGANYNFGIYDMRGIKKGCFDTIVLSKVLKSMKEHTLVLEPQFRSLTTINLVKTTHLYKTPILAKKNETTTSVFGYVASFFTDKVKKDFHSTQMCFEPGLEMEEEEMNEVLERFSIND